MSPQFVVDDKHLGHLHYVKCNPPSWPFAVSLHDLLYSSGNRIGQGGFALFDTFTHGHLRDQRTEFAQAHMAQQGLNGGMAVAVSKVEQLCRQFRCHDPIDHNPFETERNAITTFLSHFKGGFLLRAGKQDVGCPGPEKGACGDPPIDDLSTVADDQVLVGIGGDEWHRVLSCCDSLLQTDLVTDAVAEAPGFVDTTNERIPANLYIIPVMSSPDAHSISGWES